MKDLAAPPVNSAKRGFELHFEDVVLGRDVNAPPETLQESGITVPSGPIVVMTPLVR